MAVTATISTRIHKFSKALRGNFWLGNEGSMGRKAASQKKKKKRLWIFYGLIQLVKVIMNDGIATFCELLLKI